MKQLLRPLALLALVATAAACGGSPPLPLTIGEICSQKTGTMVVAEGYLGLPMSSLRCADGQCQISFYDEDDGVSVEYVASATPDPGKLTLPPARYSLDDLSVTLVDGSSADRTTRVRITGPVRVAPKICYLEAYTTERP